MSASKGPALTTAKHFFYEPEHGGRPIPNLRVYIPRVKDYVDFRSSYFETDDALLADDLLAAREAGYFDCKYQTPEERAAAQRRKAEESAAAARGAAKLRKAVEDEIGEERARAQAIRNRA